MPDLPDEEEAVSAVVQPMEAPAVPQVISDEIWGRVASSWVNDHLRSSPVSQNTDGWNHLMNSIPALRDLLEAELQKT